MNKCPHCGHPLNEDDLEQQMRDQEWEEKTMNILYRKIKASDRVPPKEQEVIGIFDDGTTQRVYLDVSGYWFLYDESCDCDEPEFWLEEVTIPTNKEIEEKSEHYEPYDNDKRGHCGFFNGFNAALELLTGGK